MKLRHIILNVATAFTLVLMPAATLAGVAHAAPASTPCTSGGSEASSQTQVLAGVGQTGGDCSDAPVTHIFATAANILSIVVGVAATLVILLAGFKYITSGGDANKVGNAKGTLLYALVGLAVAALAQLLVHFVLFQATNSTTAPPASPPAHHGGHGH